MYSTYSYFSETNVLINICVVGDTELTIIQSIIYTLYFKYISNTRQNKCIFFEGVLFKVTPVRHVTGWDKDYLRKIPRVVW